MLARLSQLGRAVLGIPVKGPQEDVTLGKTAITDITQRKGMEETIRRSGAFLQTVIDAIPDVLLVIDPDYRIVLANRAARELAGGIDPTGCLTCHQLSHHRDLPCAGKDEPCPLRQVVATKAPVAVTHTHYDAEGKESFVEVTAVPVLDETGEVSYVIEACRDVTERMRLERALRLTQFSVDRAGDAVFWLGSDARFFYANARACQHLGYSREELLSMTVHDVDPDFPAEVWPKHWEELKRRGSFTFESRHRTKEGGLVPVEITVNYLEFEGKEYNCSFVRDITDRKRAEEALQKAHDELEDKVRRRTAELAKANEKLVVLNAVAETVSRSLDLQGILDSALERILELLKARTGWVYLKDEQSGCLALSACQGFLATSPEDDGAALPENCSCRQAMDDGTVRVVHTGPICLHGDSEALAREGLRCHVTIPLQAKDKVLGVMNLAYAEDRNFPNNEIQMLTSIGHQIGMAVENARLYKDLWDKEAAQQYLLGKLISAHEDERARIARELHDEAGQSLTALLLRLAGVEAMLPGGAERVKRDLAELQTLTASIVEEVRRLMQDLRPSLLDDQGLIPAIRSYARTQLERTGVKFQIDLQGVKRKLPAPTETALFRIFQEAITNIAKHAEATNGRIELRFKDSSVEAQITDDGHGFDPATSRGTWQTFGLLGMEERVAILGGTLRIDSQAGRGTKIHLTVPTPPVER
jgi:PAS domain S-box-containing protein